MQVVNLILCSLLFFLSVTVLAVGWWKTPIRMLGRIALVVVTFASGEALYFFYTSDLLNTWELQQVLFFLLLGTTALVGATLHWQYEDKIKEA